MDRSPKPQSFPDHIGETLAQQLRAFSFDGDEQSFHEAFQDHLAAYGHEDPCGRKALSMVNLLHNPSLFEATAPVAKKSPNRAVNDGGCGWMYSLWIFNSLYLT